MRCLPIIVAGSVFIAPCAQAALVGANSLDAYEWLVSELDYTSHDMDLAGFGSGSFLEPIHQTTAGTDWSIGALGGIQIGSTGGGTPYVSTLASNGTLVITFDGDGVMAFGAHTFLTNSNGGTPSGNVLMRLSDGTSFVGQVGGESSFYGWVSEGDVTITSLTYRPFLSGSGSFASLSDLRFALIPSSGALAILGLGGMVAVRWRPRHD